ncbi:hemerythrin domain-containing protein [Mumia zhuanghuii]|uniref:Hemerythrin domain-containing protein n=1 Tax=Mumia zhuanghuii TaxID=2585211 RepID=A0A5C4LY18_9ACTN|nr:hemerythrin domain-containing protein [Mumia zhuanghuii]TNC22001.1 hemerythrin domain-containing protein [Mumia zhuanghuii]
MSEQRIDRSTPVLRSLAEQTTEELGGRLSVLSRQKHDHMTLDRMLTELPGAPGDEEEALLNRICRLVFSHAFAEEAVLWPALRRALPDGEELTAQVEREHQEITELVATLEATGPGDPTRPELIARTVEVLRQDVRDEEDELLPRLQQEVDTGTLRRLGVTWELVRRTAPTRAHPIVARRPPGNVLAALPLSLIDRIRDGLDRTSRRLGPSARRALQSSSQGLGRVARRVEQSWLLRRGERSDTHVPREWRPR